jgi:hypothetical protein
MAKQLALMEVVIAVGIALALGLILAVATGLIPTWAGLPSERQVIFFVILLVCLVAPMVHRAWQRWKG